MLLIPFHFQEFKLNDKFQKATKIVNKINVMKY